MLSSYTPPKTFPIHSLRVAWFDTFLQGTDSLFLLYHYVEACLDMSIDDLSYVLVSIGGILLMSILHKH